VHIAGMAAFSMASMAAFISAGTGGAAAVSFALSCPAAARASPASRMIRSALFIMSSNGLLKTEYG